ncbi:MAG TPA: hypothetical protein VFS00_08440 [Polyangiaceae bacterium]|nr:hypothetical protein [Polyangiaceae bacterium]
MRRRVLIVLFALGTVGGFGSGFAHSRHCRTESRRASFERHVADVCARAALEAERGGEARGR